MGFLSHSRTVALALAVGASTACAGLYAPVHSGDQSHPLQIEPIRAEVDTLHFGIRASDIEPGGELQIRRREQDADWTVARTLPVDDRLADALREGRVEWNDDAGTSGTTVTYQVDVVYEDRRMTSPEISVDWRDAPELPPPVTVASVRRDAPPVVWLSWSEEANVEARIERRDVIADTEFSLVAIVDPAAGGEFRDTDVDPGGVYTYRIRYADRFGPFPWFGPWSEEMYVSVPGRSQ